MSRARCGILHAASQNRDPGYFFRNRTPALQRTAQILREKLWRLEYIACPGRSAARSSSRSGALQSRGPGFLRLEKPGSRFCEAA